MTDLFQPPDNVSNALANKLAEQHARAAAKQHDAAVVDLTAMRDQYRKLIRESTHRPEQQLQLFCRRMGALNYAIAILTETEEP